MADEMDALTDDERRALEALPRSESPPAALEDRVVDDLRARGLLRPGSWTRRYAPLAGALAASLILFVAGIATGSRWGRALPTPIGSRPQFVLFLYEGGEGGAPVPAHDAGTVEEYRDWARELRHRGIEIGGEKLKESGKVLTVSNRRVVVVEGVPRSEAGILAGYFVVTARDADEALEIARSCPHLKRGGVIALRSIDPT